MARTSTTTNKDAPPRLRLKLATIDDCAAELARLYREGKAGLRDVADVSKLANVLQILGRLLEGGQLEQRLAKLEEQTHAQIH